MREPDATDFKKQAYRIRRCSQNHGKAMTQAEAERIDRQFEAAIEEIDRLTAGDGAEAP